MQVEVWSDVVCPWCYLGKRRLEAALARFESDEPVELIWRSFELDPNTAPGARRAVREVLVEKYGLSPERVDASQEHLSGLAAEAGLDYHLELTREENTLDAHRLLQLARSSGVAGDLAERFFRAYFSEGRRLSDQATLRELALEAGLEPLHVEEVLETDALTDHVRADEALAEAIGVRGVPFVLVDRRYAITGAQSPELILEVLEQALAEASTA